MNTETDELHATTWRLVAFGRREAPQPTLAGSEITRTFTGNHVGGSAGCNTYSGGYTLEGDRLTIRGPISTRKMCSAPAGVMEQEYTYLQALSTTQTCNLQDSILDSIPEIVYDGGESLCRFEATASEGRGDTAQWPM
ncbi:MAG: META domain-containing protein [Ktedonobacterales bacterium]